ncbi:unnamed protein product [Medioppia subpectinata]|uniref:Nuclear protein MDM1 n=1 Tax=Medioppia subpectinata TaxID=1979941 RepID=A0A7R9KB12_9ACAR|nr:unnamed protein product [Medioppia subpectinata]CAG2100090.1 unnamed protein product [Medioppia subpectinata]
MMNPHERTAENTEYRRSYTWNTAHGDYPHNQAATKLCNTEYNTSFGWPKNGRDVQYRDIEPTIVAKRVDAVDSTPKKSMTITNLADVTKNKEIVPFVKDTQTVATHEKPKHSEYHSKFRPFSSYGYISGNGFKKLKDLDAMNKTKDWYFEREERNKQANVYKTRSQLDPKEFSHPIASESLEKIYSQGLLWNNYHVDRGLQALALATTLKIIEEKKQEREFSLTPKSAGRIRYLSSAPSSLRTGIQNTSNSSIRTKSPQIMPHSDVRSVDKLIKTAPISVSPKPESKIWLKPKPKAQEPSEPIKPLPSEPVVNRPNIFSTIRNEQKASAANPLINFDDNKKAPPVQPMPRTTHLKTSNDITGVKSPSPDSMKVQNDKPINLSNKYSADMTAIKSVPLSEKPKIGDKMIASQDKSKPLAEIKPPLAAKPTAKVQPSPSTSLTSIPNPGSKAVIQSIDEEVKIVKPPKKTGNVLDKARHFWSKK